MISQRYLRDFVSLVNHTDLGYNEEGKKWFLRAGKRILQHIADQLELGPGTYRLSVNRAGIAVSGEITLHTPTLYVQFDQFCRIRKQFLYRECDGLRDFAGKHNCWMAYDELLDLDGVVEKFRDFVRLAQRRRAEASEAASTVV